MEFVFRGLLILTPLTLLAAWAGMSPVLLFVLAAVAIIPLAKYIGEATEELSLRTSPGLGGFLNATFGNATELIIGIFALHAGLVEVVKASIAGSILGNLLLVLGTAMFIGGLSRKEQQFNATAAKASGSMLLLATIALVVPAVFLSTSGADGDHPELVLSIAVSCLMILAYASSLIFSLHTHKHLYQGRDVDALEGERWSVRRSVIVLLHATVAVAFVSDVLVNALTPLVTTFGWSQLFVGVIIVAIIGNVAEHLSAIQAARKDRMDLALSIAIGSATQIVMFVAPVLVLASMFLGHPMTLVFGMFVLVSTIFSVFVTNAVVEDGASNWFEGVQLIVAYAIVALAFYFHP